jgi:hypothetical protein
VKAQDWRRLNRSIDTSRHRLPINLAVSAALLALVMGACGNTPSPTPSPSPSAAPTPAPTTSASTDSSGTACVTSDLTVTGGPWGGAAGSRGSDIVVRNQGTAACLLPAGPTVAMVDPSGAVLLANTPPQVGPGPSLAPGDSIGFSLVLGNWCEQQVNLPLHFSLALASESIDIADLTVQTLDDLPPCNGPGQPPTISATAWQ